MSSESEVFVISISVPHDTQWDGHRAAQFMQQILQGVSVAMFRIIASAEAIKWEVIDFSSGDPHLLENAIRASYPEASIKVVEVSAYQYEHTYPRFRRVIKYQGITDTFLAPIVYANDIKYSDPLAQISEVMSNLREGEEIIYSLFISGVAAPETYKLGEKQITRNIHDGSLTSFVDPYKVNRYNHELTHVLTQKLSQPLYHASVFIQVDVVDPHRLSSLLVIDNQMASFDRVQFGGLRWIDDGEKTLVVNDFQTDSTTTGLMQFFHIVSQEDKLFRKNKIKTQIDLILEARELASLWHLPHEEMSASTIQWSYPNVRIPNILRGKVDGVCLGVNQFAGRSEPIYIPDRSGHVSIIGKTGVGKSTLMHQLAHQDIAANRGVAVIDPHGDLVADILRYSIPPHREKDVVVLDIANEEYPVPLNLLAVPEAIDQGNAAGQLMSVLNRLYDFSSTPTVADTMWASLVTLFHDEHPTIRDVGRLLRDEDYRNNLASQLTNAAAIEFWERFGTIPNSNEQIVRPVLWRLRALYGNGVLYPMLCHPDTLDFRSIVAQNKILLVSLNADESRVPLREQHLLGLVLLTQLQQTVMTRRATVPYYLYVDEVQHFVTTTFDTLLSEARKSGLVLTTANQYLKQLTGETLDALLGNVATMVVFQCGLDDAKRLDPYLAPNFDAEHLMHLDRYEAAITTRHHSQTLPAFSMKTLPPVRENISLKQAQEREAYLRALSRKTYTPKGRDEVLNWLSQRYPTKHNPETVNSVSDFE